MIKYVKENCPHCGYKTLVNGICMSCGFGVTTEPILEKGAAQKNGEAWTTEPPTQEGWYWAKPDMSKKPEHDNVQVVYLWDWDGEPKVMVSGVEISVPVFHFTHWLGPLPVPELPEKDE